MKVMTIFGTRPEIIRLSRVMPKLDQRCEHTMVYTGQNYDRNLKDVFFEELRLREPDYTIESKANSFAEQLALIFVGVEKAINKYQPERVLILGDTNTDLCALIVERMGIPVYHMEAGNRCYDRKVPEEKNRRAIDALCTYNLPYTPGGRENLIREGFPPQRIFVSGNPIWEVMEYYKTDIGSSHIFHDLWPKGPKMEGHYILVTAHREENVDNPERLRIILDALAHISEVHNKQVIFSVHPRTRKRLEGIEVSERIKLCEPFGFFDFMRLEKRAALIVTDSGTVQEEACLVDVPTVTIRDTTERPETVECGSNIVSGLECSEDIIRSANAILQGTSYMHSMHPKWVPPVGYQDPNVSDKVINFILGGKWQNAY